MEMRTVSNEEHTMPTFTRTEALNDGEVIVEIQYPLHDCGRAEVLNVKFQGIDVWNIMNPEDQDYFLLRAYVWAEEDKEQEKMLAAEARWERRRDDALCA